MHNFILYGSYLSIPFLTLIIFLIFKKRKTFFRNIFQATVILFLFFVSLIFIYSRFIERNIILSKTTRIEVGFSSKMIVISDIHLGVYKNKHFLERIVNKINKIEGTDAVLIPGDFTYYPPDDLETLFSPLKNIKIPVYAVLGNHDSEKPGPPIQVKLQKALEKNGVIFLHNTSATIENSNINILGLGDNWAGEDNTSLIDNFEKDDNLIIITHNPDTIMSYTNSITDITMAGHSHGGQIRIPFLYHKAIPCFYDFDQGFYEIDNKKIFVSAGVGEVGLPMRLGIPPTIEILELY